MTIAQLDKVSVIYGNGLSELFALRDISLAIAPAEMTLLLGPSGSGKTTLLQVLGCLMRPTRGDVSVFGHSVGNYSERELAAFRLAHIGFVFQNYHLFPTLRAWENIAIVLDVQGVPREEQKDRAMALLEKLGLGDRASHYPSELSGGQKQRVAIARALSLSPQLILADEPTAALDGKTGQGVAALLHDLAHREGCAVVVVSHDPRVEPYGDRVLHLEDGVIRDDRRRDNGG
ncbi:MAG: ABC transporter ATP-binding protein [Dokdonella sp.]